MANPLVVPANLQWIGAAKETTYGTPVATPGFFIPVDGSSIKFKPNINPLVDSAYRGLMSADFQQVQGMRHDTLAYKSYIYLDSCYQHYLALLGRPDAISGTTAPYTHKTSVENGIDNPAAQPPSFTLFWFDGVTAWQTPGCVLATLKTTVKVDDLVTLEASWIGLPSIKLGSPPVNTPSTSLPIPSWNSVVSIGGSAVSDRSEIALEYKRDAAEVPTINASQSPIEIFAGGVSVAVTATAIYPGGAASLDVTDFLANTQPAVTVKLSPVGDAVHNLTLQHSVTTYDSIDPQSGSKWMEVQMQGKALANATDALDAKESNTQVILVSTQSTAF
jgi:hypothetical protein